MNVRLFVHSSHFADRMSPSVPDLLGVQNRGWTVALRESKMSLVIVRRVNLLRRIDTNCFDLFSKLHHVVTIILHFLQILVREIIYMRFKDNRKHACNAR